MVLEGEPIFPFLAADPRREGILDALKDEKLISKKGPFYGVKLYPRLGYHPASKPVQEILNICIERDLPVTTHCGISGFPPGNFSFDGSGIWKYNDFGDPKHFESALKKGLRIDFAHLGSSDPTFKWAKTIVSFMEKYKNVYSDLSCYTSKEDLKEIIKLFGNNATFKKRIMYGSDFDVMNFTDKTISLEQYCRNFSDLFQREIDNMRNRNVLSFLNF
jgi:predicted TIM-barrel fold metal-dependent hydrolase